MPLQTTVPASELRERLAEYLDRVDEGRVAITRHGRERAFLIGARELRALEETLAVVENNELMRQIGQGLEDLRQGRFREATKVFQELDGDVRDQP